MINELKYHQLKRFDIDKDLSNIRNDLQDACYSDAPGNVRKIIGQTRAEKALRFGLNIKSDGYNIYVSGVPGTGRTSFAKIFAEEAAQNDPPPKDFCYIYNFKNPQYPELLTFERGMGKLFKEEMEDLINTLVQEFPQVFHENEFEKQKNEIIKIYQDKREDAINLITEDAKKSNFGVKTTNTGIYFMPIIDGTIISEEDYDSLADDLKSEISSKSDTIQSKALETMRQINGFEKAAQKRIGELEYKVSILTLGRHINKLCKRYKDNDKALKYLLNVKEDILENIDSFVQDENDESDVFQNIIPWAGKKSKDDFLTKYEVNLLTDNSENMFAPVVVDYNPTYTNLVGEIEYDSEFGNYTTDFMKIKPGLLHKANGGYLILQANDVLAGHHVWELLKRVIKTKKLTIESNREYSTGIAFTGIKPEAIDINFKLILIGSYYFYDLLSEFDDDFGKYFKINAIFDYEMDYNKNNLKDLLDYIKIYSQKTGCEFDSGAVSKIVEYCMRYCESQNKLPTTIGFVNNIMDESAALSRMDNKGNLITAEYIIKAIKEKEQRVSVYEEKLNEMIERNILMIETDGSRIAQINGLAVFEAGDSSFARPTKITATTYVGKAGIVNIEKEAEMSGNVHDKGVEVILGYLGQTHAQEFPLSLSCRICFEQNYSGIDGDSASSTELYAVLSSLANAPIRQDIAVTGSINQRGEIQAIGGVTYKVEGFFNLCKKRGLTGKQGVIIPFQNVSDLVLKDEVTEAVKEGKFHIYTITNTDEGIELLTGIPAGKKNNKGRYPQNSIHGKVHKKLEDFYKRTVEV